MAQARIGLLRHKNLKKRIIRRESVSPCSGGCIILQNAVRMRPILFRTRCKALEGVGPSPYDPVTCRPFTKVIQYRRRGSDDVKDAWLSVSNKYATELCWRDASAGASGACLNGWPADTLTISAAGSWNWTTLLLNTQ